MPTTNPKNKIAYHNSDLLDLRDEDTINLDFHPKSREEASIEQDAFDQCFKLNDDIIPDKDQVLSIDRNAFTGLFTAATAIEAKGNFVTGLRIEYGYDTTESELRLVFIPIRMHKGKRSVKDPDYFNYEIVESSEAYLYNSGLKTFVPTTARENLTTHYKEQMSVRRYVYGTEYSGFAHGIDVNAAIFSFQELFALMYDNRPDFSSQNIFDSTEPEKYEMEIYSTVHRDDINAAAKHSLIIITAQSEVQATNTLKAKMVIIFEKMYANLAHLCPPHCAGLGFKLDA